jgi:hypothetical protein
MPMPPAYDEDPTVPANWNLPARSQLSQSQPYMPMDVSRSRDEEEYKYRGSSGARYKYDLSDPIDRIMYQTDPIARLGDRTFGSSSPDAQMDRRMGERGGGIKW